MKAIVDFQTVEDDVVYTSVEDFKDGLALTVRKGLDVLLDDTEGRQVMGRVLSVRKDGLVKLRIFWTTWRDLSLLNFKREFVGVQVKAHA